MGMCSHAAIRRNHMQQSWVQDKFYPIDRSYVAAPHFVDVTYHRLAIRSSLNSQLILSTYPSHTLSCMHAECQFCSSDAPS